MAFRGQLILYDPVIHLPEDLVPESLELALVEIREDIVRHDVLLALLRPPDTDAESEEVFETRELLRNAL